MYRFILFIVCDVTDFHPSTSALSCPHPRILSGNREVYLIQKPEVMISDYEVKSTISWNENDEAQLAIIDVEVSLGLHHVCFMSLNYLNRKY